MQPGKPKLLDQLRTAIRVRHYSIRTEEVYVQWVKRYIYFHGKRHPKNLNAKHVTCFLSHLAVERKVAASTQNQALCALVFLYRHVLEIELGQFEGMVFAKRRRKWPEVFTREEVEKIMTNPHRRKEVLYPQASEEPHIKAFVCHASHRERL